MIVYRYALAAPHEGADVVLDQMRHAHEYRCALTGIEQARRELVRTIETEMGSAIRTAQAELQSAALLSERLATEMRSARAAKRKRCETEPQRAALTEARAAEKATRLRLREARASLASQCAACRKAKSEAVPCPHASPEAKRLRARLDEIDLEVSALRRWARGASELYWGTYCLVERACAKSFSAPLYERDGLTPHDPRMPRTNQTQSIGVQIQSTRPLTVAGACDRADPRLGIQAAPWPEAWIAENQVSSESGPAGQRNVGYRPDGSYAPQTRAEGKPARWLRRRANREAELRLRVGPDGESACWRVDMHRPMPEAAQISWVMVSRTTEGPNGHWHVCFTVEEPAHKAAPVATGSAIAIDLGWRLVPCAGGAKCHGERTNCHELRVCGYADNAGKRGELRLTRRDLELLREPSEIQSERNAALDAMRGRLQRFLRARTGLPVWMTESARTLHAWRAPSRFIRFLRQWEAERPKRDMAETIAFEDLRAWASADRGRWSTEESRRGSSLRRRRERYRIFAAWIVKNYETIVLKEFDLRSLAKRKAVGEDTAENEAARSNRQLACVSSLRAEIIRAAKSAGRTAVKYDAADTTRTCPSCGMVAPRDAAHSIRLHCECGAEWDQDVDGAPVVLLARLRERPEDAKIVVAARNDGDPAEAEEKKSARWARAKRMSAAKRARHDAAREQADNDAE